MATLPESIPSRQADEVAQLFIPLAVDALTQANSPALVDNKGILAVAKQYYGANNNLAADLKTTNPDAVQALARAVFDVINAENTKTGFFSSNKQAFRINQYAKGEVTFDNFESEAERLSPDQKQIISAIYHARNDQHYSPALAAELLKFVAKHPSILPPDSGIAIGEAHPERITTGIFSPAAALGDPQIVAYRNTIKTLNEIQTAEQNLAKQLFTNTDLNKQKEIETQLEKFFDLAKKRIKNLQLDTAKENMLLKQREANENYLKEIAKENLNPNVRYWRQYFYNEHKAFVEGTPVQRDEKFYFNREAKEAARKAKQMQELRDTGVVTFGDKKPTSETTKSAELEMGTREDYAFQDGQFLENIDVPSFKTRNEMEFYRLPGMTGGSHPINRVTSFLVKKEKNKEGNTTLKFYSRINGSLVEGIEPTNYVDAMINLVRMAASIPATWIGIPEKPGVSYQENLKIYLAACEAGFNPGDKLDQEGHPVNSQIRRFKPKPADFKKGKELYEKNTTAKSAKIIEESLDQEIKKLDNPHPDLNPTTFANKDKDVEKQNQLFEQASFRQKAAILAESTLDSDRRKALVTTLSTKKNELLQVLRSKHDDDRQILQAATIAAWFNDDTLKLDKLADSLTAEERISYFPYLSEKLQNDLLTTKPEEKPKYLGNANSLFTHEQRAKLVVQEANKKTDAKQKVEFIASIFKEINAKAPNAISRVDILAKLYSHLRKELGNNVLTTNQWHTMLKEIAYEDRATFFWHNDISPEERAFLLDYWKETALMQKTDVSDYDKAVVINKMPKDKQEAWIKKAASTHVAKEKEIAKYVEDLNAFNQAKTVPANTPEHAEAIQTINTHVLANRSKDADQIKNDQEQLKSLDDATLLKAVQKFELGVVAVSAKEAADRQLTMASANAAAFDIAHPEMKGMLPTEVKKITDAMLETINAAAVANNATAADITNAVNNAVSDTNHGETIFNYFNNNIGGLIAGHNAEELLQEMNNHFPDGNNLELIQVKQLFKNAIQEERRKNIFMTAQQALDLIEKIKNNGLTAAIHNAAVAIKDAAIAPVTKESYLSFVKRTKGLNAEQLHTLILNLWQPVPPAVVNANDRSLALTILNGLDITKIKEIVKLGSNPPNPALDSQNTEIILSMLNSLNGGNVIAREINPAIPANMQNTNPIHDPQNTVAELRGARNLKHELLDACADDPVLQNKILTHLNENNALNGPAIFATINDVNKQASLIKALWNNSTGANNQAKAQAIYPYLQQLPNEARGNILAALDEAVIQKSLLDEMNTQMNNSHTDAFFAMTDPQKQAKLLDAVFQQTDSIAAIVPYLQKNVLPLSDADTIRAGTILSHVTHPKILTIFTVPLFNGNTTDGHDKKTKLLESMTPKAQAQLIEQVWNETLGDNNAKLNAIKDPILYKIRVLDDKNGNKKLADALAQIQNDQILKTYLNHADLSAPLAKRTQFLLNTVTDSPTNTINLNKLKIYFSLLNEENKDTVFSSVLFKDEYKNLVFGNLPIAKQDAVIDSIKGDPTKVSVMQDYLLHPDLSQDRVKVLFTKIKSADSARAYAVFQGLQTKPELQNLLFSELLPADQKLFLATLTHDPKRQGELMTKTVDANLRDQFTTVKAEQRIKAFLNLTPDQQKKLISNKDTTGARIVQADNLAKAITPAPGTQPITDVAMNTFKIQASEKGCISPEEICQILLNTTDGSALVQSMEMADKKAAVKLADGNNKLMPEQRQLLLSALDKEQILRTDLGITQPQQQNASRQARH